MSNHTFCRVYYYQVLEDVKKHVAPEKVKQAWVHKSCTGTFEFHGPEGFYAVAKGDCKWSARVDGWQQYLRQLAI